ncbi:MAG: hypothetical protein DRP67_00125 [Candidatus Omnitrophota bacterium]|nr:MAG: hypothetical protein DRP67_00125 [Candidatus Omnitrophota bacterium]HDN98156.1 hypothetical protein [bacterium]
MNNIFLSAWRHCDLAGKADLVILGIFSLVSWCIIIEKFFILRRVRRNNKIFKSYLERGEKPPDLFCPLSNILKYGLEKNIDDDKFDEYIEKFATNQLEALESNLSFLATTSAICPFLGLLGTVWGLLLAFNNMAITGSSSIKVVASGVAEALITTVVGLIVAIPAAIGYNWFLTVIRKIGSEIEILLPELISFIKKKRNE